MSENNHEPQLVKTCRSGKVTMGIFLRFGDHGPYLEPAKPVYRYRNDDGETKFSGYLRDRHCIHAAVCYQQAHDFVQQWKSSNLQQHKLELVHDDDSDSDEFDKQAA